MPYVRTTLTISVGHQLQCRSGETAAEAISRFEAGFRDRLDEKLRLLVAMARGPGGTITWNSKPAKEPPPDKVEAPEMPPPKAGQLIPLSGPPTSKDPRVAAELDAISQGRLPNGGLE